jgi:hypothetical protein
MRPDLTICPLGVPVVCDDSVLAVGVVEDVGMLEVTVVGIDVPVGCVDVKTGLGVADRLRSASTAKDAPTPMSTTTIESTPAMSYVRVSVPSSKIGSTIQRPRPALERR